MKKTEPGFWPFTPKISIISAFILLAFLLGAMAVLRNTTGWPGDESTNTLLIGIFVLSLLPVILAVLNVVIERGGSIGYGDFKIDFAKVQQAGHAGITIPANIGVPGIPVADSATSNILGILKEATSSGIVVVDLEDGHAWWETRLLVLLSGAARLNKPDKIVFVGTDGGHEQTYIGWGRPAELLQQLLKEDKQYQRSYYSARSTARQWELAEPPVPPAVVITPAWMVGTKAANYSWMAYSYPDGLPNDLLMEQVLQNELGVAIENPGQAKHINIMHLEEVFKPVLIKANVDKSWPDDKQVEALFTGDAPYIAITENERYEGLVARQMVIHQMLRNMLDIGSDKAK